MKKGVLSVVATPLGNLEDITLRALRVLKEADIVACEDTRVTKKLLAHFSISTNTISFHAHSGGAKLNVILSMLRDGKKVALVTDAGTPSISDPGAVLVSRVREVMGDHAVIEAVPGPSALTAALSVSGISGHEFLFLGFLPHKKGRMTLLHEIAAASRAVVFFESTHRVQKMLASLATLCPHKHIIVCRELTKMFETVLSGTAGEILSQLQRDPHQKKGEFVIIVEPSF